MTTFGLSAFLKLICLNERPGRAHVRNRLVSGGGGYDFHRSLRLRVRRYLVEGEPIEDVVASARDIARAPEQRSVQLGLERLERWRRSNPGEIVDYPPALYESPSGLYKVSLVPDFGIQVGGAGVAVHVWNTAQPRLEPRLVYAALALFPAVYAEQKRPPDDLAVLSLPDETLFRLSEAGRHASIGPSLALRVEEMIRQGHSDLGLPPPEERPGERP
jgi:hypothetical protein